MIYCIYIYISTYLILFLCSHSLFADEYQVIRRVEAHCLLKDFSSAKSEAETALILYPDDKSLYEVYICTLAKMDDERALIKAWKVYIQKFPDQIQNRPLIEKMAWGIIEKGAKSASILTRISSLLAGFFTQGSKGVDIIYNSMRDSNSGLRAIAVEMAGHLHDDKLKGEIKRLFFEERVWVVRKQVLEAIGNMKIKELIPSLEKLIATDSVRAEEKALAVKAVVCMLENIDRKKMESLCSSCRTGLRLLACQIGSELLLERDLDLFIALTKDYHSEVRAAAVETLGLLKSDLLCLQEVEKLLYDTNDKVALNTAWLFCINGDQSGWPIFEKGLNHTNYEIREYAASVLSSTGSYGSSFLLKQIKLQTDLYVKMNLAIGLVGHQIEPSLCGEILRAGLLVKNQRWSWQQQGIFRILTPRSSLTDESSGITSEMENQLTRLEILNILAVLEDPEAMSAVREFVSERTWGITASAAALLLTEGNEESISIVRELLQDSSYKVRIQAALILSLWSHEESAIKVLEEGYERVDREMKIRIIEGIGRIGSMSSLPFLLQVMEDSSQIMRMVSAMAIIQCLNH